MPTLMHAPAERSLSDAEAMRELEVCDHSLSEEVRARLDREGYLIIPGVIDAAWLQQLRDRVDALAAEEGPGGFHENKIQGLGQGRLADLVNKGAMFDRAWSHPLILAAARHALQVPFRLFCLNHREPAANDGLQGMHRDSGPRIKLQCIWCLDAFTPDNGSTRAIPGSHHPSYQHVAPDGDPTRPHADEIPLCAPAGSMILYHGNLLHSGTLNRSGGRRRSLILAYIPRTVPQLCDQAEYLRVSTARRLTPLQRWLLDA
jgi:ectoine hydroxylase-related dioxygenase (phytanoyl-CoA dioxygenase family)